jgi:phenylacetate-CoA ligase
MFATGPAHTMPIDRPPAQQLAWLRAVAPAYLLTYPTNLAALLDEVERQGVSVPGLRQVRTIGETLAPAVRQRAQSVLGVTVADTYSSQELGTMAIQCPHSGLYHVMAEGYLVEVLDPHGAPCGDGATGRLVVTDLHNFAMPLIRYDLGDYAEVGPACTCGRGLPTLRRIVGRERNMVTIRGQRHWPLLGFHHFRAVAPIIQYQLVQSAPECLQFRHVSAAPLSAGQQRQLTAIVQQALGHPFEICFTAYEGSIPLPASGKFEEFVSLLV